MSTPRLRHLAAAASIAAAAGLLAACGPAPGAAQSPGSSKPSPGASEASPGSPAPAPGPTIGLLPAPPQLTDRLALPPGPVTAGIPIKGTLVVINHGGKAINLNQGCRPYYAVVLSNGHYHPRIAYPADCSRLPFMIKPGINRLPVTVDTTYLGCTQSKENGTDMIPACLRGPQRMPPLPAGRYQATLQGDGIRLPPPVPVPVTLVSPSAG